MDKEKMMLPPSWAREEAMKEISRGRDLVAQLRALLASWLDEDGWPVPAGHMFETALRCLSSALSVLQSAERLDHCHDKARDQVGSLKKKKNMDGGARSSSEHKRRRLEESWSTVTTVPFFDGYQWRKYGQKHISNSQFQRNYYRCSHNDCKARKIVEQKNDADPPEYAVTYGKQHTCNSSKGSNKIDSTNIFNAPNPINIESDSFNSKQYDQEEEEPVVQEALAADTPCMSELILEAISPPGPIYSSAEWWDIDEFFCSDEAF